MSEFLDDRELNPISIEEIERFRLKYELAGDEITTKQFDKILEVRKLGFKKYGIDGWKNNGVKEKCLSAIERHLSKAEKGEKQDSESGLSHYYHVCVNALILAKLEGEK